MHGDCHSYILKDASFLYADIQSMAEWDFAR